MKRKGRSVRERADSATAKRNQQMAYRGLATEYCYSRDDALSEFCYGYERGFKAGRRSGGGSR